MRRAALSIGTIVLVAILIGVPLPLRAAELFLLGGVTQDTATDGRSSAWQLEYLRGLGDDFAVSLSYLNEGHLPNHHRDGEAASLWARTSAFGQRLSLAAGAGPYLYADTTGGALPGSSQDDHGVAAMLSVAATWRVHGDWLLRARTNLVEGNSIDTLTAVVGVGYQLDPSPSSAIDTPPRQQATANELTIFAGEAILNTFHSEGSVAASLEYRRRVWSYLDWTVEWLYEAPGLEGAQGAYRRDSLVTQAWAVQTFANDRFGIGVGAGPLVVIDHEGGQQDNDDHRLAGVVTLTGNYFILPQWNLRFSWNRIITTYDQDADVILGGIGFCF